MAKYIPGDPGRRLIISCPPELRAALEDMADATGVPVATVARQALEEMIPNLHDLAKYLRLVKAGKKDAARKSLHEAFGSVIGDIIYAANPAQQTELPLKGGKQK